LSTLERILVRLVVFAVFIVGLYVVAEALLQPVEEREMFWSRKDSRGRSRPSTSQPRSFSSSGS